MPTEKSKPPNPLIAGADIKRLLGIADRTLARWFEQGLRVVKRDGKSGRNPRVRILDLLKWVYDKDYLDPDLASSGGTSANLEKYRAEKARQAKRENDIAEGRIVETNQMHELVDQVGRALSTEIDAIGRTNGPEVERALREAIDRAKIAWRGRLDAVSSKTRDALPAVSE